MSEPQCTGPFTDVRDCPVHRQSYALGVHAKTEVPTGWYDALKAAQPQLRQIADLYEVVARDHPNSDELKQSAEAVRAALLPSIQE